MGMKAILKKVRDDYVIRQVRRARLPEFADGSLCRYRIVFSGRVQKVGFRLEVSELAKRLGLTGYCCNLENGDVLAEVQGPEDKIRFMLSFLASLKRIKITNRVMEALPLVSEETVFLTRKSS